jgi:23S rRNA (guanosine2251-2'-O)-methyltransferase
VREAIRAHGRRLTHVLVDDRELPRLEALLRFASAQGVTQIERVSRAALDRLCGTVVHQGVAALAPALRIHSGQAVLEREKLIAIALDGVQDPQNFGAVVRSAVALASAPIVWPEHASAPLTPATFRASAGAIEHATLARVPSLVAWLDDAVARGVQVVGLDAQGEAPLSALDLREPTIIVLGNEHEGLGRAVRRRCTRLAQLAPMSHIDSLNASVAAALALYEVSRQRTAAP